VSQNLKRFITIIVTKDDDISQAQVSLHLIGCIGGTNIYGFICEYTGGEKSPYGMIFLVSVNLVIFLSLMYLKTQIKVKQKE